MQTESAFTLSMAAISGFIPQVLVGPFAGVLIDRFNRRTVMMVADGFIALTSAAFAGHLFFVGQVPSVAAIPLVVPREELPICSSCL